MASITATPMSVQYTDDLYERRTSMTNTDHLRNYFRLEEQKALLRLSRAKEMLEKGFPRYSFGLSSESDSDSDAAEMKPVTQRKIGQRKSQRVEEGRQTAMDASNRFHEPNDEQTQEATKEVQGYKFAAERKNESLKKNLMANIDADDSSAESRVTKKEEPKISFKLNKPPVDERIGYAPVSVAAESEDDEGMDYKAIDKFMIGSSRILGGKGWIQSLNPFKKHGKFPVDTLQPDPSFQKSEVAKSTEGAAYYGDNFYEISSVPVKATGKTMIELNDVRCVRQIEVEGNTALRCVSVSKNCDWLAVGTESGLLALWRLPDKYCIDEDIAEGSSDGLSKTDRVNTRQSSEWFIKDTPDIKFVGHTSSIIQLVWSSEKEPKLLSIGTDSSVRLWLPGNASDAIAVLHSSTFPTGVCFHPQHPDTLFVGSLDRTLEVWKLVPNSNTKPVRKVALPYANSSLYKSARLFSMVKAEHAQVSDLVTSLSLSPNGRTLAVGYNEGSVAFYDSSTLSLLSEVDCKNRRGKNAVGRKVTGVVWSRDGSELCVTTNDSRIRILDAKDLFYISKFKGHVNATMLLRAEYTTAERHIVCGSENGFVCVWKLEDNNSTGSHSKFYMARKRPPTCIAFEALKVFPSQLTCLASGSPQLSELLLSYITVFDNPRILAETIPIPPLAAQNMKKGGVDAGDDTQQKSKSLGKDVLKWNTIGGFGESSMNYGSLDNAGWIVDNKLCIVRKGSPNRRGSETNECRGMVFFAGNSSGYLRILVNIGGPTRKV